MQKLRVHLLFLETAFLARTPLWYDFAPVTETNTHIKTPQQLILTEVKYRTGSAKETLWCNYVT